MRFSTFEEMLRHHPCDAPALCYDNDGESKYVSYGSLCSKIDKRVNMIKDNGVSSVGIVCVNSVKCIVEIFASVKANKRVVLFSENVTKDMVEAVRVNDIWADETARLMLTPYLAGESADHEAGEILFFTSGTTSVNKAVILSEKSLCSSAYNGSTLLRLDPDEQLLCILPLDHVFGFVCGLLWGLNCGCCVALGRGVRHYHDDLKNFSPDAISLVPLLAEFLLRHDCINSQLKTVIIGAGSCSEDIIDGFKKKGIRVSFGYGLSETSSGVAISLGDDPYAMTICPDFDVTIADDGEILVSSDTALMKGYFNDKELTSEVLNGNILKTGDLGYIDEKGLLHITGRKKEIIVLSDGTKIFIPEYEGLLGEVLFGLDFTVSEIEGQPYLVVALSPFDKDKLTELIEPVMKDQPIGKRIKDIIFLDTPLPRTSGGKIKRGILNNIIKAGNRSDDYKRRNFSSYY